MRRRILYNKNSGGIGSNAKTCDVVFVNKNDGKLTIVEGNKWSTTTHPKDTWEPIGVVVIPGEHGVLKDGTGKVNQCGVISLVPMNYYTPEKGGTSEEDLKFGFVWGYSGDITGKSDGLGRYDSYKGNGLQNYDVVCYNGSHGEISETIQGTTEYAYLPSDNFSTVENPYDISTSYFYNNDDFVTYYIPSPYNNDGSYNPIYSQTTSPSSPNNALSDFKGIVNTKIITDLATGQSNWKTASAITNDSYGQYYPPACCCARFKTTGTKAFVDCTTEELRNGTGFWYLPACGELGYIIPRLKQINQTINALKSAYRVGSQISTISRYWSSSDNNKEIGAIAAGNSIDTYSGSVSYLSKNSAVNVRAFMRL